MLLIFAVGALQIKKILDFLINNMKNLAGINPILTIRRKLNKLRMDGSLSERIIRKSKSQGKLLPWKLKR